MATIWNNRTPAEAEPRTVPETQRWLFRKGFPECTERDAGRVLFMRGLVRDGTVSDSKVDSDAG